MVGRRGEACGGRDQAEAEAAVEDDNDQRRDWSTLVVEEARGEASEVRRGSGVLI